MEPTTYKNWNRAIVHAVTADVEQGSPVYLDIDEERIRRIGVHRLAHEGGDEALGAFLGAVRQTCVCSGRVDLNKFMFLGSEGCPGFVAFLATLVMAAYDMGDDEQAASNNFFLRLRERLHLPTGEGRPAGLDALDEEHLWKRWNQWLAAKRWTPTAYPGKGATRYIHYARSQTLLRTADRDTLTRLYTGRPQLLIEARRWDPARHLIWLGRHGSHGLTANLKAIIEGPDPERRTLLGDAVAELVAELGPSAVSHHVSRGDSGRRPRCGLYRSVHPFTAAVRYLAFLQLPADIQNDGAEVLTGSQRLPLKRLNGPWIRPLAVPGFPTQMESLEVAGIPGLQEIPVPRRDHWVLVSDPDNPLRGDYATWRTPELGERFILLGHTDCREQMDRLKEEGVLDWTGEPASVPELDDWLEWRECKILSPSWDHLIPVKEDLFDELRPSRLAIGISLQGGLPGPERASWMEGHPPVMRIAVFGQHRLLVRSLDRGEIVAESLLNGEEEIQLPADLAAGDYLIEVLPGDADPEDQDAVRLRVRNLHMVAWDELKPGEPDHALVAEGLELTTDGARIAPMETSDTKEDSR